MDKSPVGGSTSPQGRAAGATAVGRIGSEERSLETASAIERRRC